VDTSNLHQAHADEHRADSRRMFERALTRGRQEARVTAGEPGIFHTWAWGFLQSIESREQRHAALDGLMVALDERPDQ